MQDLQKEYVENMKELRNIRNKYLADIKILENKLVLGYNKSVKTEIRDTKNPVIKYITNLHKDLDRMRHEYGGVILEEIELLDKLTRALKKECQIAHRTQLAHRAHRAQQAQQAQQTQLNASETAYINKLDNKCEQSNNHMLNLNILHKNQEDLIQSDNKRICELHRKILETLD